MFGPGKRPEVLLLLLTAAAMPALSAETGDPETTDPWTAGPMRLEVTTPGSAARVGDEIAFAIDVENTGSRELGEVVVEVPVAANTLLVSAGFQDSPAPQHPVRDILLEGHKVLFQVGALPAGGRARVGLLLRPRVPGTVLIMPSATCQQVDGPVFCRPTLAVEVTTLGEDVVRRCAPAVRWAGAIGLLPLLAVCRLISSRVRAARLHSAFDRPDQSGGF